MTAEGKTEFVYVTYIRTTPERLWAALTDPVLMREYWFGMHQESDFKAGSPWPLVFADGRVADTGTVLEAAPPRRLVLEWQNKFRPELAAEGSAQCRIEIELQGEAVKLTIVHAMDRPNSQFIGAVPQGWPMIVSNLKSLLETGSVAAKETFGP